MKTKQDFPSINERPPEGVREDGSKIRVLVVDDSMFVAKQIGQILSSEGYEIVATAVDGKEGVDKYKDLYPNSSKLFAYERRKDNELLLVVSNFSNKPKKIRLLKKYKGYRPELLLNNYKHLDEKELKPYQSILIHLKKK